MDEVRDSFRSSTWGWLRGTLAGIGTVLLGIAGFGVMIGKAGDWGAWPLALTGLAVLVLVIVATVAGGLLVRSHAAGRYTIGSCVTHTGSKPHRVDCGTPGAYRVASEVDDPQRCTPGVPYIEVDHSPHNKYYCLLPTS